MFLPRRFLSVSLLSVLVMVCLVGIERSLFGVRYFSERMPEIEPYNLWHAWVSLSLSLAAIQGFTRDASWLGAPALRMASRRELWICIAMPVFAAAAALHFSVDAAIFSALAREDNIFEWLSALLIFASSVFFALAAMGQLRAARGEADRVAWLAAGAAASFSLVLFIVGMEEISWMQRVFGISTPDALLGLNKQQELNLHNISTGFTELLYYTGSFVLLTLAPFVWLYLRKGFALGRFEAFTPSVLVLAASAPMAAFNSDNWSMLPTQMMVMMTIIILLVIADLALRGGLWREFTVLTAGAILIVAIQELFVLQAQELVRIWDPTEYKELFIAVGLAIYGYETWSRLRSLAPATELLVGRRSTAG
ncbi:MULTISPECIES: hypothetical protein [unclassified Ensifer]|uniref:hypothetical protein n=1 Tax=unclassified Ensifer TaxID=2633371 RepID=UPI0007105A7E|nr:MULTISPECIES: hypothetical protein [unclassified Ensifer]KQW62613.1 hypothetical protein ASD02_00300 [Ensifer sp. Root1252]KRC83433.1 hypothetical protein ASE32_00295 [Ensifer sp. Root231]KRC86662.1 hypothetical protein ASE47_17355 [Ensifer sp. Root258]